MVTRHGFLGQVILTPPREPYQSYPNAPMKPTFPPPGGTCPPGKMPFTFADRVVCVDSGYYPVTAPGALPGAVRPPGEPQIQPPIETPPQSLENIVPDEPAPVPSTDDLYPYRTSMAPEGENGCPPGQYRPTWSARCIPKGGSPIGAFGGFGMAPSAGFGTEGMGPGTVPFTMAGPRAMLGRVRLVGHPFSPSAARRLGQALKCWKTEDGGTVCNNGLYYLPGCHKAPAITESEVQPAPPGAQVAHETGKSPVPA